MTAPTGTGWRLASFTGADRPYVAIDPGLKTGVAYLTPAGDVFGTQDELDAAMLLVRDLLVQLGQHRPVVLCEAFIITSATVRKSQAPWSLEGIGVARFLARRHGADFELQQPNEAKRWSTDARLKAQGWYKPTPGGHLNDALRHLYLGLSKRNLLVPPAGVR